MRRLPLVLLAMAALLAPAQALAASPTPTARYFLIIGLVVDNQKVEANGKISIDGGRLAASAGCNTIGGRASLSGDVVTIDEPLAMTAMGCPPAEGAAEDALVKALQRGPFRITAAAWIGDGAQILVTELVGVAPDPNPTTLAPDEPVGGSPGAVLVDPPGSCPPVGIDPGFGSGSTSGGSGESAAGAGAAGDPGAVPPAPPAPDESPALDQQPAPILTWEPVVPDPRTVRGPCAEIFSNPDATGAGAAPLVAQDLAAGHGKSDSAPATIWVGVGVAALLMLLMGARRAARGWLERRRPTRP